MNHPNPTLPAGLAAILAFSSLGELPLRWIAPAEVPPPFHQLLVHHHDMTSELAGFHGSPISLSVIQSKQTLASYTREVTLHASGRPVEYGLIEILLENFPDDLRAQILAGDAPLGAILNASGLPYRSAPQGFFSVPGMALSSIFQQSGGTLLYGRYNHLLCSESTCLARILEILSPAAQQ